MKKFILPVLLVTLMMACNMNDSKKIQYPHTKTVDVVDTFYGIAVPDPYRWLEHDSTPEVEQWVKEENRVTNKYLDQIPFRSKIKDEIAADMDYARMSALSKHGDYYYFYKNSGLQNQSVLYRMKNPADTASAEVFLDPNKFSDEGRVTLQGTSFTKDGSLMAYLLSEGGSDWRDVVVINTTSGEILDSLNNIKFSGVSWKGNEGFYYSTYEIPKGKNRLTYKTVHHSLFYHQLGTNQSEDKFIFGGEKQPHRYIGGYLTEDQRYLILSASNTTSGNELYIKDLSNPNAEIVPVVTGYDSEQGVVDNDGSTLYIYTNKDAPNYRLVKVDAAQPQPENWENVIPEDENVLSVSAVGGYFFATYMEDVKDKVYQYDKEGNRIREVEMPTAGNVGGFGGHKEDTDLYYTFTSFTYPTSVYHYDIKTGKSELYWQPELNFNPEDYETKQVFYKSKDGTEVPMYIVYKKGMELKGKNPTYLYGYGGFNISLMPSFSSTRMVWLNHGGIYAQANIRGGGEYGEDWHKAGTKMNKQNVFDDFIAAGEYLIKENYTSSSYLAIAGGSNGGLLVGAVMTQRPDLMQVALPWAGVLDMLRYNKFTAGAGWASDYGTAEDSKAMFKYLLDYSPLHNVADSTVYPATLVWTADHDDRVVPAHSFKFAATLQAKDAGVNPILLQVQHNAGHGTGMNTEKLIQELTDRYAFTWYNMGVNPYEKE